MRFIRLLLILLIYTGISVSGKDFTPYTIKAGAGAAFNMHKSSFSNLPGFPSCCPQYDGTLSVQPYLFAGFEYDLKKSLFGLPYKYSLQLEYLPIGAMLEEEEFIGNVLYEDTYIESVTLHTIDADISLITAVNSMVFEPISLLPLNFDIGIILGFAFGNTFEQDEQLIKPSDRDFPDGTKHRNKYSDDLPDASMIYYGLSLGAGYSVAEFSGMEVVPYARFHYFFNDISSVDWKVSSLIAGISLKKPIEKPRPPIVKPQNPPLPKLPDPEKPIVLKEPKIELVVMSDGSALPLGKDITIRLDYEENIEIETYYPVIFYTKNSTDFAPDANTDAKSDTLEIRMLNSIISYLQNNPGTRLSIAAYSSDEDIELLRERIDIIKAKISDYDIDEKRIKSSAKVLNQKDYRYPELLQESRRVELEIENRKMPLELRHQSRDLVRVEEKSITFSPRLDVEATPGIFSGTITLNDERRELPREGASLNSTELFQDFSNKAALVEVHARVRVKDANDKVAEDSRRLAITFDENIMSRNENLRTSPTGVKYNEYILGYFNFDATEFDAVNSEVIEKARQAAFDGRLIEVIPLTDDLGTPEYNENLRRKRGIAALELLKIDTNDIQINAGSKSPFDTSSPYGRVQSRSVLIRIK